jgi:SAM-dependent methyltransferase
MKELINRWTDSAESHRNIHEDFCNKVNAEPELKALRDWVEQNIFGFGERSFLWMWKLILETKAQVKFLEVGVFRGQTLAIVKLIKPNAKVFGITPLDSTDGHWESDYAKDIKIIHDQFNLKQPTIIKGLSTDPEIIQQATSKYDIVYIDGGHTLDVVRQDLQNYSPMVKQGGYLVIDDCCNKYKIPHGMFPGIQSVSQAVDEWFPNEEFKELFSVVHIRVFEKI